MVVTRFSFAAQCTKAEYVRSLMLASLYELAKSFTKTTNKKIKYKKETSFM